MSEKQSFDAEFNLEQWKSHHSICTVEPFDINSTFAQGEMWHISQKMPWKTRMQRRSSDFTSSSWNNSESFSRVGLFSSFNSKINAQTRQWRCVVTAENLRYTRRKHRAAALNTRTEENNTGRILDNNQTFQQKRIKVFAHQGNWRYTLTYTRSQLFFSFSGLDFITNWNLSYHFNTLKLICVKFRKMCQSWSHQDQLIFQEVCSHINVRSGSLYCWFHIKGQTGVDDWCLNLLTSWSQSFTSCDIYRKNNNNKGIQKPRG